DVNVEWMGCKEFVQEVNEMFHAEEDIDFKDFEDFDSGTNSDNEGQEFVNSQLIKDMGTRVSVEQRMELHLKKNDKLRVRLICRPSEASGFAKSKKETKDSGSLKSKKGLKDSNGRPWVLQCSKLK
nr:transposase, mutator type [Tanacetum cinerariifolium]